MSAVAIMFLVIGLRLLITGGIEIFAARQVAFARATFVGKKVYRDHRYSGIFDMVFSIGMILAALFGNLALDLHWTIILVLVALFELKCEAVESVALTVAGIIKEHVKPVDAESTK